MEHMNPQMSIVAECQDHKHAILFNVSEHVSLVYTTRVANNLLVQEAQDPGVTLLTETITSNMTEIEETVVSTTLKVRPAEDMSYTEAAKRLLDHGVNLVGVIRQGALIVGFDKMSLAEDDSLVYISKRRHHAGRDQRFHLLTRPTGTEEVRGRGSGQPSAGANPTIVPLDRIDDVAPALRAALLHALTFRVYQEHFAAARIAERDIRDGDPVSVLPAGAVA